MAPVIMFPLTSYVLRSSRTSGENSISVASNLRGAYLAPRTSLPSKSLNLPMCAANDFLIRSSHWAICSRMLAAALPLAN
jgi:hypothetical protein